MVRGTQSAQHAVSIVKHVSMDQVEELKWQRRQQQQQQQRQHHHHKTMLTASCATPSIDDTDWSDTDLQLQPTRWCRSVAAAPDTPDSWARLVRPITIVIYYASWQHKFKKNMHA